MKENFEIFFDMCIAHEGGFTDDQDDNGNNQGDGHGNKGSTMWGVTAYNWAKYTGKPAPIEVMKKLTKADVMPFAKEWYWDQVKADLLPHGIDVALTDMAYNAGNRPAVKLLQRAVAATDDGLIGKMTIAAAHDMKPEQVVLNFRDQRQKYYDSLGQEKFIRGWTNRNEQTTEKALEIIEKSSAS